MTDDVVLSAVMRAGLQQLQTMQAASLAGLKQAGKADAAVVELVTEARGQLSATTATRGTIVDILA